MSVAAEHTNRKFVWTDITLYEQTSQYTHNFSVQGVVPNKHGVVKLHAQVPRGEKGDQNKYLLSSNYMSEMRPCSATDRQIKVWLSLEIKQNHWGVQKKSCISFQFRADVQTYGHRPQYTPDNSAAETDVCTQKCQVAAWWLMLPEQYGQ